jgi:hypothetical protein
VSYCHHVSSISGFREEDLNVIFFQNMPNLHNRYKLAERKISQKHPEYMLNYSLPFSSETTGPIATKLWWNGPWMAPFKFVSGDTDFQPRWPPS